MDDLVKRLEDKLDDRFNRVENKQDEITKEVGAVNVTLIRQEGQLAEHIRRTQLAEENLSLLRSEFKPVEFHVQKQRYLWSLVGKVCATIVAAVTMAVGLIEIFKHLRP